MLHGATSEKPPRIDRDRVARPRRQRIAGWCAVASGVAVLLLLWFLGSGSPGDEGLSAMLRYIPFVLIPLAALGAFFVLALVSVVYWLQIEFASNEFPWRRGRGGSGRWID